MKKTQLVEFLKSIGVKEVIIYSEGAFIEFIGEDDHGIFRFDMDNSEFSTRGL